MNNKDTTRNINPETPRLALRELVNNSGIKHKYIAEQLDISAQRFSKLLAGTYRLDTPDLVRIINIIGASWDDYSRAVAKVEKDA